MNKERELLRRALECWNALGVIKDYDDDEGMDMFDVIEEIRTYLSTPSDDAEEPTKIEIEAEREDIDWQSNEGAVYLFAGWLTTRDTIISCGRTENAAPMAEAIKEYKAEWPERFTKPAEPEADHFCDSNCTWLDHHPQCIRANPVARKPLTEEEIDKEIATNDNHWLTDLGCFSAGVRFAEKYHGIANEP